MPWATIVNAVYGNQIGGAGQQDQGQAQQAMALHGGQGGAGTADLYNGLQTTYTLNQEGGATQYNRNLWGQVQQQYAPIYEYGTETGQRDTDFIELLDDFNNAFQHGIREVVVDKLIYQTLYAYFNRQQRYAPEEPRKLQNSLTLATAGGYIVIRPEGANVHTGADFDRYMEDVDGNAP